MCSVVLATLGDAFMVDLTRSESDILVFVSSVMNDDLKCARKITKDSIEDLDFGRPWAFEFTPASSEDLEQAYLRKVSEADFVVWLVGSETTDPVANEINQCLASKSRLLVFKLPSTERCELTTSLLDEVSGVTKWQDLGSLDELSDHIKSSFADEFVRALRDPAPRLRKKRLSDLYSLSVSRCKATWQSLGVAEAIADELSLDFAVGDKLAYPDYGPHTVVAKIGHGKSLACHRLFQKAINRALEDPSQPFPVLLDAKDLRGSLINHIEAECHGCVDPFTQGVLLIIDGVDERGVSEATELLRQASTYAGANPRARVLVTMRPIPRLEGVGAKIAIPSLSDGQMIGLLNRLSGLELDIQNTYLWPDSMRQAARIPLFTVMIASRLKDNPELVYASQFRLIEDLVEDALSNATDNTAQLDRLLHILATRVINSGGPVLLNEVDRSRASQGLLIASRLVSESGGKADFTLPIFREWYAARALLEGTISLDGLEQIPDRWLLPFAMAIHSGDAEFVHSLMAHLVATDPGLASQVLHEHQTELRKANENRGSNPASLASAEIAGKAILSSLETWNEGLGDLYRFLGPIEQNGKTSPLHISMNQSFISTLWYHGTEPKPRLTTDPGSFSQIDQTPAGWSMFGMGVAATELWPWSFSKAYLTNSFSSVYDYARFALTSDDAVKELSWEFACAVAGNSRLGRRRINAQRVLGHIEDNQSLEFETLSVNHRSFSNIEVKAVKEHLQSILVNEETCIADPWPESDLDAINGPIWTTFSPDRLLSRTQSVYAAALRVYEEMVSRWFGKFAFRLRLHSLMPIRLEGCLDIPAYSSEQFNAPRLMWQPRILPQGTQSDAKIELGRLDYDKAEINRYFAEESEVFSNLRNRPSNEAPLFRHTSMSVSEVFEPRPATMLACEWIRDELRDLQWEN